MTAPTEVLDRAELARIRKARQHDLNEAVLHGYPDAPSRSEYQLRIQRVLAKESE